MIVFGSVSPGRVRMIQIAGNDNSARNRRISYRVPNNQLASTDRSGRPGWPGWPRGSGRSRGSRSSRNPLWTSRAWYGASWTSRTSRTSRSRNHARRTGWPRRTSGTRRPRWPYCAGAHGGSGHLVKFAVRFLDQHIIAGGDSCGGGPVSDRARLDASTGQDQIELVRSRHSAGLRITETDICGNLNHANSQVTKGSKGPGG